MRSTSTHSCFSRKRLTFCCLPYFLFTSYELFIEQHLSSPSSRLGDITYLHYYWLLFSFPLLAYSSCLSNCHLTLLLPYEQYLHHLFRIPKESLNRLDITSSHILLSRGVAASDIEPIDLNIPPATPLTPLTTILESQNYHIASFRAPKSIPPIQYISPASMAGESSNQTGEPSRGPTIAITDWSLSSQHIGQRSFMQRKTRRVRDKSSTFEDWPRIYGTVC